MDDENHNVHTSKFDAILDSIETKFDILLRMLSERYMVKDNIGEFENNSFKIPETGTPVVTTTSLDEEIVFDGGREFKEDEHYLFDKIPQWSNFGDEEVLKKFGKPMVTDVLERNDVDFNYIETELLAEKIVMDNIAEIEDLTFKNQEPIIVEVITPNCNGECAFDSENMFEEVEEHMFDKSCQWSEVGIEKPLKNSVEPMLKDDLEIDETEFPDIESGHESQEIAEQLAKKQNLVVCLVNDQVCLVSSQDVQLLQCLEFLIPQKGICLDKVGQWTYFNNQIDRLMVSTYGTLTLQNYIVVEKGNFFGINVHFDTFHFDGWGGKEQCSIVLPGGLVSGFIDSKFYEFENHAILLQNFGDLKVVELATITTKNVDKPWEEWVTRFKGGTIVEGIIKFHLQGLSKLNQNMTSLDYRNIDPVAAVSLLLSALIEKIVDPAVDPVASRSFVFTVTFFIGTYQALFGIFRLGFLVDFLSHAAIVGFMGDAAIIIGLQQQLKGLLGINHFTTTTDIVSFLEAVFKSLHPGLSPLHYVLGCSFLIFVLITRVIGRKNRKFFWLPAIAPLLSVILSTLIVYLTKADRHGVNIVKHFKGGLNIVLLGSLLSTKKEEEWQEIIESCQASPKWGEKNRKFFWLPAIAPLLSVILSTLIVYLTKADRHGVNIVKHFKGGLNIVLLGSLLSTKKEEEWQEIIESCQASPKWGENYDLIPLSYNDLPANLKLCLIYMVLFPKEFDIPVRRLQSLWLAEGFVKRSKKPSDTFQEDVVKRYFDNLVKRSLIQVSKLTSDGRPKRCRLLGVLHDHLSPKARVISLFHVHHQYSDTSCQDAGPFCVRRLVEYTDIKNCSLYPSQLGSLRSYLSFNIQKKDTPATEVGKLLSNILSNGLGLLRVLDLEGVYKLSLPNNLGDFFHLRYLGLRWTFLDSLPESVGHLHYLETLDIKHTHINTLPSFIWKMKHLKHLYANGIHLVLPRHLCSSFPQLLSLWGFSVDDSSLVTDCLNSLVHLRELGITFQLSNSYEIRD